MCTSCPIITVSTHWRGVGHARGAKHTLTQTHTPHMETHIEKKKPTKKKTHVVKFSQAAYIGSHLHIIAITGKYTEKVLGQADTKLQACVCGWVCVFLCVCVCVLWF